MDSAERERTASAVRRSWLSTAATAGLVGALMFVLAPGTITAYFDAAGALEVLAAVVIAVVGSRRAAQVLRAPPGERVALARPTAGFVSLLSLVPILVVGAGLFASR